MRRVLPVGVVVVEDGGRRELCACVDSVYLAEVPMIAKVPVLLVWSRPEAGARPAAAEWESPPQLAGEAPR